MVKWYVRRSFALSDRIGLQATSFECRNVPVLKKFENSVISTENLSNNASTSNDEVKIEENYYEGTIPESSPLSIEGITSLIDNAFNFFDHSSLLDMEKYDVEDDSVKMSHHDGTSSVDNNVQQLSNDLVDAEDENHMYSKNVYSNSMKYSSEEEILRSLKNTEDDLPDNDKQGTVIDLMDFDIDEILNANSKDNCKIKDMPEIQSDYGVPIDNEDEEHYFDMIKEVKPKQIEYVSRNTIVNKPKRCQIFSVKADINFDDCIKELQNYQASKNVNYDKMYKLSLNNSKPQSKTISLIENLSVDSYPNNDVANFLKNRNFLLETLLRTLSSDAWKLESSTNSRRYNASNSIDAESPFECQVESKSLLGILENSLI